MKKLLGTACCILSLCLLAGCGNGKTLDMKDYIAVSFEGFDTWGTATVDVDYDALARNVLGEKASEFEKENFTDAITVETDQPQGLANGDIFTVHVAVGKDCLEEMNLALKLKESELAYEVKGLTDVEKVDVFQGVSITCTGYEPFGQVTVVTTSTDLFNQTIVYAVKPDKGLKNGDTVTVHAVCRKDAIEKFGYVPAETEREFIVSGLGHFVTELEQFDQDVFRYLTQRTVNVTTDFMQEYPLGAFMKGLGVEGSQFSASGSYGEITPLNMGLFFGDKETGTKPLFGVMCQLHLTIRNREKDVLFDDVACIGMIYRNLKADAEDNISGGEYVERVIRRSPEEIYEACKEKFWGDYVVYDPITFES